MTRRIGFCCQWFHHDRTLKKKQLEEIERPMNTRSTTVRWLNEHKDEAEAKLDFVFKHNIDGIKNLILKVSTLPKSRECVELVLQYYLWLRRRTGDTIGTNLK